MNYKVKDNQNVIYYNHEGTQYIQFKRLLEYPEIKHCYTLKKNNVSIKVNDQDDSILQESYDKIAKAVRFSRDRIVKPHQTHTDRIEKVISSKQKCNEVDGLVTNRRNIALCTTSADCTSLLLYDPVEKVISSIHSGWRGTLQKIGQKAVKKMMDEYHSKPENIICCICPCIKTCHFEVDEDVKKQFEEEFEYLENNQSKENKKKTQIIYKGRNIQTEEGRIQKYNVDTTLINIWLLQEIGIKKENIIDSGICTVCNSNEFHSYRVEKENSGRNAAMIELV